MRKNEYKQNITVRKKILACNNRRQPVGVTVTPKDALIYESNRRRSGGYGGQWYCEVKFEQSDKAERIALFALEVVNEVGRNNDRDGSSQAEQP